MRVWDAVCAGGANWRGPVKGARAQGPRQRGPGPMTRPVKGPGPNCPRPKGPVQLPAAVFWGHKLGEVGAIFFFKVPYILYKCAKSAPVAPESPC